MRHLKKALTFAVAASVLTAAAPAIAQDAKIGMLMDLTGPIESLAPPILAGAELAVTHVNDQGGILGGQTLESVVADSACDATMASSAADRLVNTEQATAIVGGLCSGATIGGANSAAIPGNVVMISPASTAGALTTLDDNDLVFRTTPSDAFQGIKLADLLIAKGIDEVAVTYLNNDYGSGLASDFTARYEELGGTIAISLAHEEGRADYRADLGSLAASGAMDLLIIAYASGSGQTILRQAVESGDFTSFIGADGMVGDDLFVGIDASAVEGMFATRAGSFEGESTQVFVELATEAGIAPDAVYAAQAYDAAFLLALAIEKNGSADRDGLSAALREVASAPGETIYPGEWEKAVELIAAGEDINYVGASGDHEFDENGDVEGVIVEYVVQGGTFVEVGPIE
ncbi:ABC transporter substrate-binding protein [Pelagibacterium lentulum]|uniref:Branched-chain amino acid ABC transporter substrate-binding protein n=1 Tax=Pelagibacterium lentulum TaxID=2029865 RepID=A0A916R5K1_9HYPH|nr:ABC transporter substrate-binding protein [Pelagibacterium lentulum]GGA35610.1 branched-chain amino acid ABC transporter substrate-binding protein [Pelagibacterium lentulum]